MRVYESTRELRIACKHDVLLPSLSEYAPHQESCEIECDIPVKRFCRGTEKADLTHTEDDVRVWRILLTADVSVAEIPVNAQEAGYGTCLSDKQREAAGRMRATALFSAEEGAG